MVTELQQPHKDVFDLLERATDVLVNGSKDRQRDGKAVFYLAGEYMKQGGGHKSSNWKVNFSVNDVLTLNRHVGLWSATLR